MTGKTVGKYIIEKEIGSGGMGVVYLGSQPSLGRKVAIKMLPPQLAISEEFRKRFEREAKTLARLAHPNIVQLFDFEYQEGTYFIIMEYVDGPSLSEIINAFGQIPIVECCKIVAAVASALYAAHMRGIVHRDIKPENIMVNSFAQVKVTDFGIARVMDATFKTQSGVRIGTPLYMSPEQAKGESLTFSSDQYSLGIVFYEMVTGKVPFDGESSISVAIKHIQEDPVPPSKFSKGLSREIENFILKLIAKSPSQRFPDCSFVEKEIIKLGGLDAGSGYYVSSELLFTKKCKFCGQPVKSDFMNCPKCGGALQPGAKPVTPIPKGKPEKPVIPEKIEVKPAVREDEIFEVKEGISYEEPAPTKFESPKEADSVKPTILDEEIYKESRRIKEVRKKKLHYEKKNIFDILPKKLFYIVAGIVLAGIASGLYFIINLNGGNEKQTDQGEMITTGGVSGGFVSEPGQVQVVEKESKVTLPSSEEVEKKLETAEEYFQKGLYELAKSTVKNILKSYPEHVEANALLKKIESKITDISTTKEKAKEKEELKKVTKKEEFKKVAEKELKKEIVTEIKEKEESAIKVEVEQKQKEDKINLEKQKIKEIIFNQRIATERKDINLLLANVDPSIRNKHKAEAEKIFKKYKTIKSSISEINIDIVSEEKAKASFLANLTYIDYNNEELKVSSRVNWVLFKKNNNWYVVEVR